MHIPFASFEFMHNELQNEIQKSIGDVVKSNWFIRGQKVEEFEAAFAEYCGAKYCVGCGNGLDTSGTKCTMARPAIRRSSMRRSAISYCLRFLCGCIGARMPSSVRVCCSECFSSGYFFPGLSSNSSRTTRLLLKPIWRSTWDSC